MSFHPFIQERDGWRIVERTQEYANPHLSIDRVVATTPSRPEGVTWTVAHRKAASVVVPRLPSGDYLLIRQERLPILDLLWEFPAGQIEIAAPCAPSATDAPAALEAAARETALRELQEETGYELAPGAELIALGHFFPSSGFMDEVSFLYLATEVIPSPRGSEHDSGEAIIDCRPFSVKELSAMVASGELRDANSLAAFARLSARESL